MAQNNPTIFPYVVTLDTSEVIVAGFMTLSDTILYATRLSRETPGDIHVWQFGTLNLIFRNGAYQYV